MTTLLEVLMSKIAVSFNLVNRMRSNSSNSHINNACGHLCTRNNVYIAIMEQYVLCNGIFFFLMQKINNNNNNKITGGGGSCHWQIHIVKRLAQSLLKILCMLLFIKQAVMQYFYDYCLKTHFKFNKNDNFILTVIHVCFLFMKFSHFGAE